MLRRIAIVGGGISGLGAAWGLHHHPDRFDFRLFEDQDRIGGNAVTADMPQDDGNSIPFDISVTACTPSVYQHIVSLMKQFGIELIDTRFSYSVKYRGHVYAHDFDSEIREQLQSEIAKFQRILKRLHWFGHLSRSQSKFLNALNPFNYISMGTVLNLAGFSGDFRYKISLNRPVRKVYRQASGVVVEDENGVKETFDEVIFACNANQTLMILDKPTMLERYILSSIG